MGNDSTTKKPVQELLYDGFYYDVSDWIKRHPGGNIIEFYTKPGEDASIAIKQFHHRSTDRVMGIMKSLKKRPALEPELLGTQSAAVSTKYKALTDDYMALYKEFLDEGLFKPSLTHALLRICEPLFMGLLAFYGVFHVTEHPYIAYPVFILATLTAVRTGYAVHDGGHRSLTGNVKIDRFLQSFGFGFVNGMSSVYWNRQHNRHHAFPQRMKHDIDLDTLPLIAFNKEVVKANKKFAKYFWIQNQAFLFHFFDTFLVSLVWRFYLHPRYAIHKRLYLDLFFMTCHNAMWFYLGGFGWQMFHYFTVVWVAGIIMFGNFALNHTHMPVTSENESLHWVQYSFQHTIDISHTHLVDWWMGYLNYQIEHHLFPGIQHFRLWRTTDRVKAFAAKHDLPYRIEPYWTAVRKNLQNLHQVSQDIKKIE